MQSGFVLSNKEIRTINSNSDDICCKYEDADVVKFIGSAQETIDVTSEINVREKEALKVYISPSNQSRNLGVSDVGYTNEMDEMNDVADYVIERLKSYGVKVYRNYPSGGINAWLREWDI